MHKRVTPLSIVASAIALSTKQPVASTWQDNFLWSAPSYFVGALAAALAATVIAFAGYWMAPLAFAPLYLTYRTYKVYMARIEDEPYSPEREVLVVPPSGVILSSETAEPAVMLEEKSTAEPPAVVDTWNVVAARLAAIT